MSGLIDATMGSVHEIMTGCAGGIGPARTLGSDRWQAGEFSVAVASVVTCPFPQKTCC